MATGIGLLLTIAIPATIDDLHVAGDGKLLAILNTKDIMRSTDHCAHWLPASIEPDDDFAATKFLPVPGLPLHAAVDDQMLRSADIGAHWIPTEDRFKQSVLSMAPAKDGSWLAAHQFRPAPQQRQGRLVEQGAGTTETPGTGTASSLFVQPPLIGPI